jgi:hypothetical protein
MEKKELENLQKIISATTTAKKPVKDIKTSILQDLGEDVDSDSKKEYFKMVRKLGKLRSRLAKEEGLEKDDDGKTIVTKIDDILKEHIPSPKPTIQSAGDKYRFDDGSEADLQSYSNVMNMFIDNAFINRISKMQIIYSEALAVIMKLDGENDLWYKDKKLKET